MGIPGTSGSVRRERGREREGGRGEREREGGMEGLMVSVNTGKTL